MKKKILTLVAMVTLTGVGFGQERISQDVLYIGTDSNTSTIKFDTEGADPSIMYDNTKKSFIVNSKYQEDITFTNGGNQENFIIKGDTGNVGIGTTNPTEKLEVKGKIYLNSGLDEDGIYWGRHNMVMGTRPGSYRHNIFKLKPGGASQGYLHSILEMYIANSETDHEKRVQIHANGNSFFNGGNVGVGAIMPKTKLEVRDDTKGLPVQGTVENSQFRILSNNNALEFGVNSEYNSRTAAIQARHSQENYADHYGKLLLNPLGGNIGIGTYSPDEMLTVKGKIHAEEVRVDLSVPADYVFEKYYTGESKLKADYTMPTLEEVEAFTKANNHLPNVPSAKQIQEEGLHLKEMTNLLLQKVEELTLYTIEQNRINKEQEEKIKQLEEMIQNQK